MNLRVIKTGIMIAMLWLCSGVAVASEAVTTVQQVIPYKVDKGAMAGAGVSIFVFLILFIGLGALLYYLKKREILKIGDTYKEGAIKVLGVRRLNPKTMAFVINANGTDVLVVQANDNISLLPLNVKKE